MLVSIRGQSLSTSAPATAGYPWPPQLGGSAVTFNGIAAALSYVSSTQINAIVPGALQRTASASVVVTTAGGSSAPVVVPITGDSLGIFTQDMTGCGQAVAFNVHADGTTTMNTPQNSLDPFSDWGLTLFFTGLGALPDRADGVPWQYNSKDNRAGYGTEAQLGISGLGGYSQFQIPGLYYPNHLLTTYFGPAPLKAGVDQVNVALPTPPVDPGTTPQGCRVPLYLATQDSASQIVHVSIHSGGGACVDSGVNSLSIVTWGQNTVSDASGTSTSSSIAAQFLQGNQLTFITARLVGMGQDVVPPQPAICAASYPTTLSAGTMTISNGSSSVSVQPQIEGGVVTYQATLPTAPGGMSSISATGTSPGVGAFTATAAIPPPIAITTNLQPGTKVSTPFTLTWTGADDRSAVTVEMIAAAADPAPPGTPRLYSIMPGSAGAATVVNFPNIFLRPRVSPDTASPVDREIIVTQQPAALPSLPFTAPGLTVGGEQTWKYVWVFRRLQ